jgi:hypothetical protein
MFGVIVEGRLYVLSNRDQQFPLYVTELQCLPVEKEFQHSTIAKPATEYRLQVRRSSA